MKQKPLTERDLSDWKVAIRSLAALPGINSPYSSESLRDLFMNGSAFGILVLDQDITELIWTTMGMSKSDQRSAYEKVIASNRVQLVLSLFKAGGWFSTTYHANASIAFEADGRSMEVRFGCVAGTHISALAPKLHLLLTGEKSIPVSTEEALREI